MKTPGDGTKTCVSAGGQGELDEEALELWDVRRSLGRRLLEGRLLPRLEAAVAAGFPHRAAGRREALGAAFIAPPLPGERSASGALTLAVGFSPASSLPFSITRPFARSGFYEEGHITSIVS